MDTRNKSAAPALRLVDRLAKELSKELSNIPDPLERAKAIQDVDKAIVECRQEVVNMYRRTVVDLKASHSNAGLAHALGISVKRLFAIRDKAQEAGFVGPDEG